MGASSFALNSIRSISLPTKLHSDGAETEAQRHLKAMQKSSNSTPLSISFKTDTIQIGLIALSELYNCVEQLANSPRTQQALVHYQNGKIVEKVLHFLVMLLDVCSTARDILLMMKEQVHTLRSTLRRRVGDLSIERSIHGYHCFKKNAKKEIAKCFKTLKQLESKAIRSSPLSLDQNEHISMVISILEESNINTISILHSLLLFLSMPMMKSKGTTNWPSISRLVCHKVSTLFHGQVVHTKDAKAKQVQMAQNMLDTLSDCIQGLETRLECNFRCLIQNRVSFLNILTQYNSIH